MEILRHPAGIYQANCYIVFDEKTKEGFIIDPGGDADEIIDIVKSHNLKIKYIFLTHGHFDHTGGVNDIKRVLNIPVMININDNDLISDSNKYAHIYPVTENIIADGFLKEGDRFNFGLEQAVIIETPGHTQGGVTIRVNNDILTGDTLFYGSVGRSDLPGGDHDTLIKAIKEKLLILPDEARIYPGHGPSSTVKNEKRNNPFL